VELIRAIQAITAIVEARGECPRSIITYTEPPGTAGWSWPRAIRYAMSTPSGKYDLRMVDWKLSIANCVAPVGTALCGLYSMPGDERPNGDGCTVRRFWDFGDNGFVVEAPRR
jgi:hypothetical protein